MLDVGSPAGFRPVGTGARGFPRRRAELRRPWWHVRAVVALVVAGGATVLLVVAFDLGGGLEEDDIENWVVFAQSAIQDVVFVGIGLLFLFGIEARMKRRRALAGIHELRSFAHVVDMHQLTKDPERLLVGAPPTEHSPERITDPVLLGRYLEYCSEMLSITSKLAADCSATRSGRSW